MRVMLVSWTLSVVACLLTLSAVLTLARASSPDHALQPQRRTAHLEGLDIVSNSTGHAQSVVSSHVVLGPLDPPPAPSKDGQTGQKETYPGENWRHKTLGQDGAVISDTAGEIPNTDMENSRFGSGNPRLKFKSIDKAPFPNPVEGGDFEASPPRTVQQPVPLAADGDKPRQELHELDGSAPGGTNCAGREAVAPSLPRPRGTGPAAERMVGDDPRIVSKPAEQSTVSNSSATGSINNGDLAVYPSPRKTFYQDDIQLGCRELRARRYITDGYCTSIDAIKEVVCAGSCLPIKEVPWYAEFIKTMARSKLREWQCVEDFTRRKKVKLVCKDHSIRTYRIKVVRSCRCERVGARGNRTSPDKRRRKGRRRKRKGKSNGDRDRKKRKRRRRRRKNKRTGKARVQGGSRRAAETKETSRSERDRSRSKTPSGS